MAQPNLDHLVIDDREKGLFRVHRSAFTDQQIFEAEQREIFDKVWLYAGHESELKTPGAYVTRKVGGRPLILTRDAKGQLGAFLNSCPHRGNVLCRERSGTTKLFTCFYHAWAFATDGTLAGLPGESGYGPGFDRKEMGLKAVPRFANYRGMLFISYNKDVVDLVTYLGGAKDRLDAILDNNGGEGMEIIPGQQAYSMRANWKLLVENSMDGYHAMSVHQRYFRTYMPDMGLPVLDIMQAPVREDAVSRGYSLGNGHGGVESNNQPNPLAFWAKDELAAIRGKLDSKLGLERASWVSDYTRNLFIFPNLIMISMWNTVRTFYPISPDYMEIEAWALLPKGESQPLRQKRFENFLSFLGPAGFATPDDVSGLEGCQRGFLTEKELQYSDISRGMTAEEPSNLDELQMRGFWRQWLHQMQGLTGPADCADRPQQQLQAAE